MNINVNIRNKTKLVEILREYTYKSTCNPAENYLQVETLHFDQND